MVQVEALAGKLGKLRQQFFQIKYLRDLLRDLRRNAQIAGTGIESAVETLRLTEYAAQLGYDAALVRTPHFYRKVMLPALLPAIAAGGLLVFARCLGEFGAIVIVSGNITGRTLTAPVFIFQLVSQFRYAQAAAVSALLFGLAFVLVLITERLVARGSRGFQAA